MSSLNKACLLGHLGRDPEIKTFQSGDKIANFSIATSEKWKDRNTGEYKEATAWHNIVVRGEGLVGIVEKYLKKGSKVYVEGKIITRKWQDQSGADKYTTEIIVGGFNAQLILLSGNGSGGGSRNDEPASEPALTSASQTLDDDIPF